MKSTTALFLLLRSSFFVAVSAAVVGCASSPHFSPYRDGPIEVTVVPEPQQTNPAGQPQIPLASPKEMLVAALVLALLPDERTGEAEMQSFNKPMGEQIQDVDFQTLLEKELSAAGQPLGAVVGSKARSPGVSPKRDLPPLKVKVSVMHGMVKNEPPAFAPKFVARIEFERPGVANKFSQKLVFYGHDHGIFPSDGLAKMTAWWLQDSRYKEFIRHAASAIARQILHTVYQDPAMMSESVWYDALRASSSNSANDLVSDACAFSPGTSVVYKARRRPTLIALAAHCGPENEVTAGEQQGPLAWVLR